MTCRPPPDLPTALSGGRGAALLPLGVAAVALVGVGYVGLVDPNTAGHYPTCPLLAITGWYCPGCGGLRAVYALGHGDLPTALARNPFAVLVLGYLVVTWVLWFQRRARGRPFRWPASSRVLYGALFAIVTFWALRNVPGWTWLSPA